MRGHVDASRSELTIRDLAELAGTSVRTIHYYVAEGLLPRPNGLKRAATYSLAHLARLRLIDALRTESLSLEAISRRLSPLTDEQVISVAATLDAHRASNDSEWTTLGLIEAALTREAMSEPPAPPPGPPMPSPASQRRPTPPVGTTYRIPDADGVPKERSFLQMTPRPPEQHLRESATEYLDQLLQRRQPLPNTNAQPRLPLPSARSIKPDPYQSVRPVAWYHFMVEDGVELRVREDRYREARGQLRAIVDALRPTLKRYGLSPPDPPDDI